MKAIASRHAAKKQLEIALPAARAKEEPGQQAGHHYHPCSVLGYIVKGTATYKREGHEE